MILLAVAALVAVVAIPAMFTATVDDVLGLARAQLGIVESPANSNRQKFGAYFGRNGVAWCGLFVSWVFAQLGVDLRRFCSNIAYTPTLLGDLRSLGWGVARNDIVAGDLVFFDFPGGQPRTEHVGVAVGPIRSGKVTCIEGNTSVGGSQSNGGQVLERTRPVAHISGAVRVPLARRAVNNALAQLQQLRLAINYARLGFADIGAGHENTTRPGRREAIQIAQTLLNRWADQFAAMVGQPNPPDLAVTGEFDQPTRAAVIALQQLLGINELGTIGPRTWEAIDR